MKISIKKGAIALAFITSIALTTPACASINDITYATDASGYIDSIEGTVSYKILEDCYFAKVTNNVTDETYYTIALNTDDEIYSDYVSEHYDIFNRHDYENEKVFTVEYFYDLTITDWLVALDKVKAEYTEEELRELLNIFIEKQEKDKQLVKE